jgi:hypothetical protein
MECYVKIMAFKENLKKTLDSGGGMGYNSKV